MICFRIGIKEEIYIDDLFLIDVEVVFSLIFLIWFINELLLFFCIWIVIFFLFLLNLYDYVYVYEIVLIIKFIWYIECLDLIGYGKFINEMCFFFMKIEYS